MKPATDVGLADAGDDGAGSLSSTAHWPPARRTGQPDVFVVLERHLQRHADLDVVRRTPGDAGRQAKAFLLGQLDDGDDIGRVEPRIPRLVVDGERVQCGSSGDRLDGELFRQARGTERRWWMDQYPHCWQRRNRSTPSSPLVQKWRFVSSRRGSRRNGCACSRGLRALHCHRSRPRAPGRTHASREEAPRPRAGCRTTASSA